MKELHHIIKEDNNHYRFEIRNESDQLLFMSASFPNKAELMAVIKDLQSFDSARFLMERKTDYQGKFQFQLKNIDGLIIGDSGLFDSQAGMENGIKHLKKSIAKITNDFENL